MYRGGFVYIMTNKNKSVLYIGVTSDLKGRILKHRTHLYKKSFSDKYNAEYLIYYEGFDNIVEAIKREKQMKKWNRAKKENLIITKNPEKRDVFEEVMNNVYSLL
ncbi:MAG TPA: GIY-YIG nuclease family protein [Edaphocola sp.]|nr:GIY-YIG nuclease family protein [Edaphocola sp.]